MTRRGLALLMTAVVSPAAGASAQSFDVAKVAEGVYAAIPRTGVPVGSNGAFVVNEHDVLVVDTHLRPSFARELLAEIKKVTPLPVRYVVNTHWHNDHTQGNQAYMSAFPKDVEFLSHTNTRADIVERAVPSIKESLASVPKAIAELERKLPALTGEEAERSRRQLEHQKAYLAELERIEITLPTLTFERSAVLHRGGREIRLLHFGRGHTRGDAVVYLPREKVAVMGDLLTGGVPFARDGYPSEWADVLEQVAKLDIEKLVPGHGGVKDGKTLLLDRAAFLRDLVSQVKRGVDAGKSADQIRAGLDVARHEPTFEPDAQGRRLVDRLGLFVERAMAEVRGELK
jgi:glyoxylase-like metal-dependent hydrolase (beta-lactamase superfamily II)